MSELHDRLERLATRGTRRGVDNVLQSAMRDVARNAADPPDDDHGDLEPLDDGLPFVTAEPDRRRRGRFGAFVAAIGAAALVGVGALAVTALFGSGGAGSPEGAVRQLADAVSHKDPLAAVDVLVPTEVRAMRQTIKDATQRAADLKIVDNASEPLAGVDLSVGKLELSSQALADGYAKVTITSGELSASTHAAAMSTLLQNALRNSSSADAHGNVDLARLASSSDLPTFVVTVRRDGRWYVSPAYTALEYTREIGDGPAADFGSAQTANLGADTPESAVSDALRAWQSSNWDRLVALAPPDELPVYDYRAWVDQAAADTHPDFTIDKLSTTATVNGDTAIVKLEASGTSGSGDQQGHWQVGGTCPANVLRSGGYASYTYGSAAPTPATTAPLVTSVTSSTGRVIGKSSSGETVVSGGENGGGAYSSPPFDLCLAGDLGQELPFGLFAVDSGSNGPASGPVSVEVVREDGRWFVSPVTTVLDAVDSFVNHVDQQTLYPLIGLGYLLPPDATITLNQPFAVPSDSRYAHVFAFDATKGQTIVGASEGVGAGYFGGDVYTADGHDVGFVDFEPKSQSYGAGSTATLPSTGSYRLVVTGPLPKDTTLTLFDADHAPKSLLNPIGPGSNGGGEICTRTGTGESCTSSSATVPPPTITETPPPSVSSACHTENTVVVCSSGSGESVSVATTSVP